MTMTATMTTTTEIKRARQRREWNSPEKKDAFCILAICWHRCCWIIIVSTFKFLVMFSSHSAWNFLRNCLTEPTDTPFQRDASTHVEVKKFLFFSLPERNRERSRHSGCSSLSSAAARAWIPVAAVAAAMNSRYSIGDSFQKKMNTSS